MLSPRDFLPQPPWEGPPIPSFISNNKVESGGFGIVPIGTAIGKPKKVHEGVPERVKIPIRVPVRSPERLPTKVPVRQ